MKRISVFFLSLVLLVIPVVAQQKAEPDDVIRVSTDLVQTDVVVTDKNDQPVPDLKLQDFELYDNGKKQDIKFMEFVSAAIGRRSEGKRPALAPKVETDQSRNPTAAELKRVIAFVIDDLTVPTEDLFRVRQMLLDFVNNQMKPGDLVSIVRSVGGNGMLQQFTSDPQLLRRSIAALTPKSHPFNAFNNPDPDKITERPTSATDGTPSVEEGIGLGDSLDIESVSDDTNRMLRALMALSTANFVIDSLKEIPGRKSLVLVSGGLPLIEIGQGGAILGNVSNLVNQMTDNAVRSGVVINTLDARGLTTAGAVAKFQDTPGRSALGVGTPGFGRTVDESRLGGTKPFGQMEGQLGLRTLASATGGVSVLNTNNFRAGLDRILTRSSGYYLLAYTPSEKFDGKFHKLQVKVKRGGVKVYNHEGYLAREDRSLNVSRTKEEEIMAAAKSPLAKTDLGLSASLLFKMTPDDKAALDIHMLIDANKLRFSEAEGRYRTTFDVVGFVYDQVGKRRGGFSETVSANLTPENYKRALATGLSYSATTQLPPGYYQLRAVVREADTGRLGTILRYMEVPDLTNRRLTMSSIFLYGVDPASKGAPEPLLASREISRKQELRYAALIYNAKLSNGKPQLRSRVIISQGDKILYQEPEETIESRANSASQISKVGQLGLSKVRPGRYTLTLIVTDPLAGKKERAVSRSADFIVVD